MSSLKIRQCSCREALVGPNACLPSPEPLLLYHFPRINNKHRAPRLIQPVLRWPARNRALPLDGKRNRGWHAKSRMIDKIRSRGRRCAIYGRKHGGGRGLVGGDWLRAA
ncbi:hypothetical protein NP493_162g05019 [Ridgeia piscesae]|uniref:Uncharacterized protein n=1 Tax=Ridgeia piscesae TaxID=27915 RepID=A0AAD9UFN8_RIDPI|nr:hypothetical protein NP493_162g05019 [Ridgeia piscesae]